MRRQVARAPVHGRRGKQSGRRFEPQPAQHPRVPPHQPQVQAGDDEVNFNEIKFHRENQISLLGMINLVLKDEELCEKTGGGGMEGDVSASDASGGNGEGDPASEGKSRGTDGTENSPECAAKRSRNGGIKSEEEERERVQRGDVVEIAAGEEGQG